MRFNEQSPFDQEPLYGSAYPKAEHDQILPEVSLLPPTTSGNNRYEVVLEVDGLNTRETYVEIGSREHKILQEMLSRSGATTETMRAYREKLAEIYPNCDQDYVDYKGYHHQIFEPYERFNTSHGQYFLAHSGDGRIRLVSVELSRMEDEEYQRELRQEKNRGYAGVAQDGGQVRKIKSRRRRWNLGIPSNNRPRYIDDYRKERIIKLGAFVAVPVLAIGALGLLLGINDSQGEPASLRDRRPVVGEPYPSPTPEIFIPQEIVPTQGGGVSAESVAPQGGGVVIPEAVPNGGGLSQNPSGYQAAVSETAASGSLAPIALDGAVAGQPLKEANSFQEAQPPRLDSPGYVQDSSATNHEPVAGRPFNSPSSFQEQPAPTPVIYIPEYGNQTGGGVANPPVVGGSATSSGFQETMPSSAVGGATAPIVPLPNNAPTESTGSYFAGATGQTDEACNLYESVAQDLIDRYVAMTRIEGDTGKGVEACVVNVDQCYRSLVMYPGEPNVMEIMPDGDREALTDDQVGLLLAHPSDCTRYLKDGTVDFSGG